jgi:hypothetical protein
MSASDEELRRLSEAVERLEQTTVEPGVMWAKKPEKVK